MGKLIDLINNKYGKLKVIKKDNSYNGKETKWICLCECGNYHSVRGADLKNGKTKSCGCLIKTNTFNIKNNFVECFVKDGICFKFDLDDYELIKKYTWHINSENYIQTTVNTKTIKLHRLIMNPEKDEYIDHINHDTLDNRKQNLRKCSNSENTQNRRTPKNNTSGVKGVIWKKKNNCWEARITYNGKRIHLGCFKELEEAKKVREEAEIKYFGEFRFKGGK
ncbi:HNH endonuclease [Bacillus xiapuensis]|uniref:AP2 domain-containing protein n=1 Tax=Bacillus xiapuensis TaxID=2014075 RepID=A0ABU6N7T7_9BACI|nr:AP2 domain-containing protein [Bacillus xiapuensis]